MILPSEVCSLSLMIFHSFSEAKSLMITKSAPISSGLILSNRKSSPYLLHPILVFLRPPLLVSMVIGFLVLYTLPPRSDQVYLNPLLQKTLHSSELLSFLVTHARVLVVIVIFSGALLVHLTCRFHYQVL